MDRQQETLLARLVREEAIGDMFSNGSSKLVAFDRVLKSCCPGFELTIHFRHIVTRMLSIATYDSFATSGPVILQVCEEQSATRRDPEAEALLTAQYN